MKNRFKFYLIVFILLVSVITSPVMAKKVTVRVDKVKTGDINEVRIVNGRIEPGKDIRISAKTSGIVNELNVNMGSFVKKGEKIVVLARDEIMIQVSQAEARVEAAKANLARLKNGVDKEDIRASRAGIKQAQASLEMAQAKYAILKGGATTEELNRAKASYQQAVVSLEGAKKSLDIIKEIYDKKISLKQQLTSSDIQLKSSKKQVESARNRYKQSKINLQQADNNLEQAKNEYNRMKKLYNQNVVTEKQFEMAETQYQNAKFTVQNGRSAVETAKIAMQQAEISYNGAEESYQLSKENFEDPIQLKQQLESARTQLEVARTNKDIAKANLEKINKGARPEEIQSSLAGVKQAEAALERAKANHAKLKGGASVEEIISSEAQLKQAEASLDLAQLKLEDAVIKSPISGYIATVNIEEGEMISPGSPVVNVLSLNPVYVNAGVSAQVIKNIEKGDKVKVNIFAYQNKDKTGTIEMISPTINPQTQSFPVKVKVTNQDNTIKGGMVADIHFTLTQQTNSLIVPVDAVLDIDGDPYLYVIEDGRAVRRNIKLGLINKQRVEVVDGVEVNETIVVQGNSSLQAGDSVEVINR
jgi:RND family efflux transporter MFP subunit